MNRAVLLLWTVFLLADGIVASATALNLLLSWLRQIHTEPMPEGRWRAVRQFMGSRDSSFLILGLLSVGSALEAFIWLYGIGYLQPIPRIPENDGIREGRTALLWSQGVARTCAAIPRYIWAAYLFQDFRLRRSKS